MPKKPSDGLNGLRFQITEEIRKGITLTIQEEVQRQVEITVRELLKGRIEHHVNTAVHDLIDKRINTLFTGNTSQVKALSRAIVQEPGFYIDLTNSVLVHVNKAVSSFLDEDLEARIRQYISDHLKMVWKEVLVKYIQES